MKAKLLKILRDKFKVEYFPSTKQYKSSGEKEMYHNNKRDAIIQMECDIYNYGRKYYEDYSKRVLIKNN